MSLYYYKKYNEERSTKNQTHLGIMQWIKFAGGIIIDYGIPE